VVTAVVANVAVGAKQDAAMPVMLVAVTLVVLAVVLHVLEDAAWLAKLLVV
jgi:hypothetical protein